MPASPAPAPIRLSYDVVPRHERWVLVDGDNVAESPLHNEIILLLQLILKAWVMREKRDAKVGSNVALRWDAQHPQVGVDPDVYLVEPAPPAGFTSLLTWKKGLPTPRVVVEVVSENDPAKDYLDNPERYAAAGVRELWIFDPLRFGPKAQGGPFVLQLWRWGRREFRRVYAGDGPVLSRELGAWLVVTDQGQRLRIANDRAGKRLWLTEAETLAESAAAERDAFAAERDAFVHERETFAREREEQASAQAAKEALLLARITALEGQIETKKPAKPKRR